MASLEFRTAHIDREHDYLMSQLRSGRMNAADGTWKLADFEAGSRESVKDN
jgi:hypothetical protein